MELELIEGETERAGVILIGLDLKFRANCLRSNEQAEARIDDSRNNDGDDNAIIIIIA